MLLINGLLICTSKRVFQFITIFKNNNEHVINGIRYLTWNRYENRSFADISRALILIADR
jgi:hypothetical protein